MSAINFITANPYVPAYQQAVSNFGQEDRAADRAVRERETWLRAENDRNEVAKALDRAQEAMRAKPAAPSAAPTGPQPPVPAQMPVAPGEMPMFGPGVSGGLRSVSSMPKQVMPMPGTGTPTGPQVSWGGNRDATVAQINSITDPAERAAAMLSFQRQGTAQNPMPQMQAQPAASVGAGGSPAMPVAAAPQESASLRMVNALGSHPALNQTRMSMMQSGAQAQDSRQNRVADKVWELAATNDPGKLAAARQLAMQAGINLPEAFWTDAGTRSRIHGILQGLKDQGVAAWDVPQFIQSQPGMNQTPAGQVALEASNLEAPIKGTIQTGGEYTTNPDGSKTYKPGPMYLNRGRTVEQATDNEGNALTSPAGDGRAAGDGAGGGRTGAETVESLTRKFAALVKAGIDPNLSDAFAANPALMVTPSSIATQARFIMKSNVDMMGQPTKSMDQAMKEASDTLNSQYRVMQSAAASVAAQSSATVGGGGSPTDQASPAMPQNAPAGRVNQALVKWAQTSKSTGVSTKAALAELKRQGYDQKEAIEALRQGGYK